MAAVATATATAAAAFVVVEAATGRLYALFGQSFLTCFSSRYSEARDSLSVCPSLVRISLISVVR